MPPNGQFIRTDSVSVNAAGKASARAATGPGGTRRQPTATKTASIAMSASAPGRVKERTNMRPGT